MKKIHFGTLLPILCLTLPVCSWAANEPDARLLAALDDQNLRYEVRDSGEISVTIEWTNDGRTQLVSLQSETFSWKTHEYRDIYSIALKMEEDDGLSRKLANRLLRENNASTLGFWAIQDGTLMNIVRLPADASPKLLRDAIFFAGEQADELEKEVLKTDDY